MAGKKRTEDAQPAKAGFKASASFFMAKGNGPSQAAKAKPAAKVKPVAKAKPVANAKPAAMNEEPHTEFLPVYIHTAKCDICEKRNYSVLQRCVTCTSQLCYRCMLAGDGIHVQNFDMNWKDYGAQANSTSKAQRKAKELLARNRPDNVFPQRYTSAADIPSCRSHHRELKYAREVTMEAFVADEIPAKAGPAPKRQRAAMEAFVADEIPAKAGPASKRQRTVTNKQPNPGRPATAAKKNIRAENAKSNHTEAQFPLIIPTHKDDYGPRFERFLSNVQGMTDHDMTEAEYTSSDNDDHDPRRTWDFFSDPFRVPGGKGNSEKPAPNPWAKEINEHKKGITAELSLIDKHLDLLKDKKRLALVRKTHVDEALDAACILMSMRADASGFPAEKETSTLTSKFLARESGNDEVLDSSRTLTSMQTGVRSISADMGYVSKKTPANTRPIFKDSLARVFENGEAVGTPDYAGFCLADRKSHLTETGRLAQQKERKIDAVVEAAYYSLMRDGRSSQ
ncbi:hypothetical protein V502_05111 [Pseudogymnoascus sp. VKM F-4520 (FW-2644)]|nr:hypothetical protein V502_05111 [Pseudogymnoascus sp. VKM F-4520 (FW-2644)]